VPEDTAVLSRVKLIPHLFARTLASLADLPLVPTQGTAVLRRSGFFIFKAQQGSEEFFTNLST